MTKSTGISRVNWFFLHVISTLSSILLLGCTAMEVTPKVSQIDNMEFRLKGKIVYEGNKEYLPRILIDESVPDSDYAFRYTYNADYGGRDTPDVVAFINPFNVVGFPTGKNTLIITGRLDILKGEEILKSYIATCALKKTRSLLVEGETLSEMRKKGLIAVRDNIEVQVCQDRELLHKLLTGK
ncbi:MAG: hypothetical protein AB1390_11115 [Nitrospirota bacterium]